LKKIIRQRGLNLINISDLAYTHGPENCVGNGSLGVVYKGTWNKPNGKICSVAIKDYLHTIPFTCWEKDMLDDWINEIQIQSKCRHPSIVRVYGVTLDQGERILLVSEFMTFVDLRMYIMRNLKEMTLQFRAKDISNIIKKKYLQRNDLFTFQ